MLLAEYPQEVEGHPDVATVTTQIVPSVHTRLSGLDGLRAIAVSAVVLFHADFYWARGGYLGVDLFFVISGFLITGLMAREVDRTGRLDLRDFYWRRAKRLLPASWLMMAVVVAIATWVARDALPHLRNDVVASLAYVTNWELLRSQTSYFEATGRPPLLQHLWSLAIEEQFYILWAPLAFILLPRMKRRGMAVIAIVLAAASAAWMALLAHKIGYPGQGDPSRLYFGTDTHGFALLLGSALGLLWQPSPELDRPGVMARATGWLLGLIALTCMVALFAMMGEDTPRLYPWGFLAAAATSLALIMIATHPGMAFGRCLDNPVMRWIGERSYGIYLWHWPVFMLTRPGMDLRALDNRSVLVVRIVLTLVVAALSYRYLEMPIRRGALRRIFTSTRRHAWPGRVAVIATLVLVFASMGVSLWHAPAQAKPAQDVRDALDLTAPVAPIQLQDTIAPIAAVSVEAPVEPVVAPVVDTQPDQPAVEAFTGDELTAVGDSVLLGSSRLLKATLPGADVHATMGWQAADVIRQIKTLKSAGAVREVALVHLGTNGYVTEDQLRQILSMLSDCKRVVLVNTHVPRRWMEANNALIDQVAPDYPNVVTVRWNDASDNQPDYFVSDGVHLTTIGQRAFITEIMRTGHLARDKAETAAADTTETAATHATGDLSPTLELAPQPAASDDYWNKMARCETDANWQNGGRHSGGLGMSVDDWKTWGGNQFAPTPAEATPAQQIEVANRISTQGWTNDTGDIVKPIGFVRWRCVAALGRPHSASPNTYTRDSVLAQTFHLGERGDVVRDLQLILTETPDGIYTMKLRKKHLAYLKQNGLPENLAGTDS
ncbi:MULTISPECIES: acyltransferase family protein [unclassified Dyella]|uniref:acyltransferase family protein n=1 Tax=unclassified Dyella TaxID=2634549 RepID=UPI000C8533CB|nr:MULTISPECIES: acyltransferase family protein [unclassified Dyella]MDR3447910.1 acyltransferase family protein [Dyella sp.]PMQ03402.1 O-acetyltransferase OatA [Dyella sp. AD56]